MEPTYKIAQRLHERRAAVGLPKYGRHLDADSKGCMLVHALEEAADQVNYLIAEIQRRREAIRILLDTAERLTQWGDVNLNEDARQLIRVIDLLGGEAALVHYGEILGGGTVANSATVAPPRSMPREQIDRIRQEIAKVAAINRPLTQEEREDFDRAMAELPETHEVTDPRAMVAEGIAELRASLPADPRDEALRVATEALEKQRRGMENILEFRQLRTAIGEEERFGALTRSEIEEVIQQIDGDIAAIRAAGGAR